MVRRLIVIAGFLLMLPPSFAQEADIPPSAQLKALKRAQYYLKTRGDWNTDCSGFVKACFESGKMDGFLKKQKSGNLTLSIYRFLKEYGIERKEPSGIKPGDILLFHYTYDANRDGAIDNQDVFTHSGIAEGYKNGVLTYLDSSKGRTPPRLRRRSFSFRAGGKNERVATDPRTGRTIRHRETYAAAYGFPNP
jgi:hypothetical protein